jgi:hypothetical protein
MIAKSKLDASRKSRKTQQNQALQNVLPTLGAEIF